MKKREIGSSGLFVNEIGYGSMNLSINRDTRPSESDAIRLLQQAVDEHGLEFIDTADAYAADEQEMGHGERLIAKALEGERRQRVVVATKGGFTRPDGKWIPNGHPDYLRKACENSLRNLRTDVIDLYQFHRPDPEVPITESLGALAELQKEGKIRHIGVSNFSREQLEEGLGVVKIESLQNMLFPFAYAVASSALLRFCEEHRITWIAYAPVWGHRNASRLYVYEEWMRNNLSSYPGSPYSVVLAWLLHLSPVLLPIPATTNIQHLAENMRASDVHLSEEDLQKLPTARSLYDEFYMASQSEDYAAAVPVLKKILAGYENDDVAWFNLACMSAVTGNHDEAFGALEKFASLKEYNVDVNEVRAAAHLSSLLDDPRFDRIFEKK